MSSSSTHSTTAPETAADAGLPASQVDASARVPVTFLLVSAGLWLVLASVLGLLASVKMHAPQLLAECPIFTYGRVQAASNTLFLYGFASQAALAIALWLTARLGRTSLIGGGIVVVGAAFWNFAVTAGLVGILIGNTTGYEWLELPHYIAPILFFAYLLIGIPAILTFANRKTSELYPAQWFLLAALFWFPWIYSTANLLLFVWPVRGTLQAVINWWYGANLTTGFLGFIGIGTILYFVAKLSGRPLHSRYDAIFGFWVLLFAGSWGGIHATAPVPAWMPAMSAVTAMISAVAALAIFVNALKTLKGATIKPADSVTFSFIQVSLFAFIAAALLTGAGACHRFSIITHFSYFSVGLQKLSLYGFVTMAFFGAAYYLLPRITGLSVWNGGTGKWHFILATAGLVVFVVPLLVGGYLQGRALATTTPFDVIFNNVQMFNKLSIIGELLMVLANLIFALNLVKLLRGGCQVWVVPVCQAAIKPQTSRGVA